MELENLSSSFDLEKNLEDFYDIDPKMETHDATSKLRQNPNDHLGMFTDFNGDMNSSHHGEFEDLLFPDLVKEEREPLNTESSPESHNSTKMTCRVRGIEVSDSLELSLLHKPRGCKGVWHHIPPLSALRVTKGKGKWLRLELRSLFELNSQVEFFLMDVTEGPPAFLGHSPEEGVTIESKTESAANGQYCLEVELKLDRVCKKLQFWAAVQMPFGFLYAKSVIFGAHNNGKVKMNGNGEKAEDTPSPVSEYSSPLTGPVSQPSHGNNSSNKKRKKNSPNSSLTPSPEDILFPETFPDLPDVPHLPPHVTEGPGEGSPPSHPYSGSPATIIPNSLTVEGVVKAQAFLQFSDRRLKTDIQEISNGKALVVLLTPLAVNMVLQLQGKTFHWKEGMEEKGEGGRRVIGLIAQEVRKVAPEVVREDPSTGFLSVAYAELVPVILEALKEVIIENNNQKTQANLELNEIREKLLKMEKKMESNSNSSDSSGGGETSLMKGTRKSTKMQRSLFRTLTIFLFFGGLVTAIFGGVLLGGSLTGPSQYITTHIVEAVNLKPMDEDGKPDAYCEALLGPHICRTSTIYNSHNPEFQTICVEPFQSSFRSSVLSLQMYDSNLFSLGDKRIGRAFIPLDNLTFDTQYDEWYPLLPNMEGDTVEGSVRIRVHISSPKKWGVDIVVLAIGVIVLTVGAFLGFYCWQYNR